VLAAFLAGGALLSGLLLNWAAGTPMRRSNPYTMHITFQHASKIGEGTPVRMKGVQIGAVASVAINPSHIDVTAEVLDAHNVVPVGSRVDINQFGLAADPFVDITPPEGCRVNPKVGPHHPKCQAEGLIVCDGQQIAGSQGGSMDYMMKQFLKYQDKSRVKVIVDEYRDG
jgi:ABC-type transporter Mla subunit MlaD